MYLRFLVAISQQAHVTAVVACVGLVPILKYKEKNMIK